MSNVVAGGSALSVLFICTGNICRSPLAAQVFSSQLTTLGVRGSFDISSAGTAAEIGMPLNSQSAKSMAGLKVEPQDHVAQQVTRSLVENANLVLVATTEHRAEIARLMPRATRYSFTMLELARIATYLQSNPEALADTAQPTDLVAKIAFANQYRGYAPPPSAPEDIDDPWGLDQTIFDRVAAEIFESSATIARWLAS